MSPLQWHYSYILPLLFICICGRERGRIPGGEARNWITYTKTTHYYFQCEWPIKECCRILANSESWLNLSLLSLFCKSLCSLPWWPLRNSRPEKISFLLFESIRGWYRVGDVADAYLILDQRNSNVVTAWHLDNFVDSNALWEEHHKSQRLTRSWGVFLLFQAKNIKKKKILTHFCHI